MTLRIRHRVFAVLIGILATNVGWMLPPGAAPRNADQAKKSDNDGTARYAIDPFVAACCVRPKRLITHEYFGSLPIGRFLPAGLSLGRLKAMDVEELVVFCGPASGSTPANRHAVEIEWAAVARTSQPIELKGTLSQWRHSLVLQERDSEARLAAIQIEQHKCFQVPAGSFFPPPRKYGELQFTDRFGSPAERGINVGRIYDNRGYVEGATRSSAIFTLDHLDEADVADGHLTLELRPDVFPTRTLDQEYSAGQIELRNPDSGLVSMPIAFKAKSYVNHTFNVSRNITAMGADGKRQVDLWDDLVSNGRLEVVLKATETGVYLGVGPQDLNVRPRAAEYVFVSGQEIVVAQSVKMLKKMLSAKEAPTTLAKRLSRLTGDIVIIANVRDESQRSAFQRLMRSISDHRASGILGDALTDMSATLSPSGRAVVQVNAAFKDRHSASSAAWQFNQLVRSVEAHAHANIGNSLNQLDCICSLTSLVLDGVSMSFPEQQTAAKARESHLLSLIGESLDAVQIKSEDNVLTARFTQPASLSRLPKAAKIALANIEEALARDLIARERFDLGDEMYQRATDRFPHVAQVWFRRAHQLAYNTSVEFDGYNSRYAWVRRGVEVLLDGAAQNPDTTDLTWMAARFIGWKLGASDEHVAYRRLFSQDKGLHERIAKVIDLEKARSPDKKVDNWLVAKLLFESCVDRHVRLGASSSIPPLLFFSRPAVTQAQYAQTLTELGYWKEAGNAWKQAEQLHKELGERAILMQGSERIGLNQLESRLAKFGPDDASVKLIQTARRRIQYDYWLARCELEQMAEVQSARKLSQKAAKHARIANPRMARQLYRQSLQTLAGMHERRPRQMSLLAGEFQHVAAGYRKTSQLLGETEEQSLAFILNLIERTPPASTLPFMYRMKDILPAQE